MVEAATVIRSKFLFLHTTGMIVFTAFPAAYLIAQGKSDINYIVIGVLALVATLPFRLIGLDIHQWFNRDDIGHVLMMIALFCFFQGVKFRESRNEAWELAS